MTKKKFGNNGTDVFCESRGLSFILSNVNGLISYNVGFPWRKPIDE